MSGGLKALDLWARWEVTDHFPVLQNAPRVTSPATEQLVEVTGVVLTYGWHDQAWCLIDVLVDGRVVLDDGTFGRTTECHFYDPTSKTGKDGAPPEWLFALAERRMACLPPAPAGPEKWNWA